MRLTRIHTVLLSVLMAGCGGPSRKTPGDATPPQPEQVSPESDNSGYAALAEAAVIRVSLDPEGQEITGSADMRIIASAPADASDASQVEQAFSEGSQPHIVSSAEELDQDSSVQAWADYSTTSNYATYQPRAYQQGGNGSYWTYSSPVTSQQGNNRYYYYGRPNCPNGICAPNQGQNGPYTPPGSNPRPDQYNRGDLDKQLMELLSQAGVQALKQGDFLSGSQGEYDLGRMLFFDPLLSGNRDTACATCHVPQQGTSNAMSLGPTLQARTANRRQFTTKDLLPRNSPALFNHGHKSYTSMFWDSRVSLVGSNFVTPAGAMTPPGLNSTLAAQALFPLASRTEMLGCLGENELADAGSNGNYTAVWAAVVARVVANQRYVQLLKTAYPDVPTNQIGIQHIANALAIFQSRAWRSDQSPFDRYLAGDRNALTPQQKQGAIYFYGKGNCGGCHAGALLTDQSHHAIAMPQFGPGTDAGWDRGLGAITGEASDNFKFKTPSLRNVAITGPWGHNGAYNSLRAFVKHYTNPVAEMRAWNWHQIVLPFPIADEATLLRGWRSPQIVNAIAQANQVQGVRLSNQEIDGIVTFLDALTDPRSKNLNSYCPQSVPSGYKPPQPWYPRTSAGNNNGPGVGSQPGTSPGVGSQPGTSPGFGNQPGMSPGFGNQPGTSPGFGNQPGMSPGFGNPSRNGANF